MGITPVGSVVFAKAIKHAAMLRGMSTQAYTQNILLKHVEKDIQKLEAHQ